MREAASEAAPRMAAPPELSIVRSGNGAPRFCLGGELLPPLVPGQKRPAAEVRALMAATAGLAFFGQMRAELRGDWRQAHAELCAQMEPVLCESDQLLFEGVHGLRRPLVLLAGRAALLALPHPTRKETVEVADVMPGDCLAPAVLTWMQPRIATAVCRGTAQLIALPATVYGERLRLPHLRLLQARHALGTACTGQGMH